MRETKKVERIIKKIIQERRYKILENQRILLSKKLKLFYQPDFLILTKQGYYVIEIELTTDMIKSLIGDIVRAGLINAVKFIGITKNIKSKNYIERYGEYLTKTFNEISQMKIFPIYYKNDTQLEEELNRIL